MAQEDQQQQQQQVLLRSVDLVKFTVPASLAQRAGRVAAAVEAGEQVVELPQGVNGKGLATAVAYYRAREDAEDVGEFDEEFVAGLKHDAAIDLIHAAHHLGDQDLFNLLAGYRAN
uniref:Uncharacterized protein n=1 Tax=Avena sativa TaxID=4498 RepID=A0ACD5YGZ3_AVESA